MNVLVNNKPFECEEGATLQHVSALLSLPEKGVAVAVNNRMVPRAEWAQFPLKENDSLVVIQAACGG